MVNINIRRELHMKTKYIIGATLLSASFSACEKDIDMPYTDAEKIYFEYQYQDPAWSTTRLISRDSVRAEMGRLSADQTQMEVKIPIKILGQQLTEDKTYKIEVVERGEVVKGTTNAVENIHYLPLADCYTFHAGTWVDTLRITALRSALSASYTNKQSCRMILRISDKGELQKGLHDGWEMIVSMSNYISEPTWWNVYGLGFYHPEKYKILLMFEDDDFYANVDILNDSSAKRCVSAMSSYLSLNVVIDEETGKRVTFDGLIDIENK